MKIWVDADACPNRIKEILFRLAIRTQTQLILVSNHAITTPTSLFISKIQVLTEFDAADNKILKNLKPGDLIITADIPLADAVISKNGMVLNPRGEIYSQHNIKERLLHRNISNELRSSGVKTSGPPILSKSEIQRFANALNLILSK